MLTVLTASITPRLADLVQWNLERTMMKSCRLIVVHGRDGHGPALDEGLDMVTTPWVATMDDDAAGMLVGWLDWLLARVRLGGFRWGGFHAGVGGRPHPLGAVYDVAWLRSIKARFARVLNRDVGQGFGDGEPAFIAAPAPVYARPWWLGSGDAAVDDDGRLIFAHLGGGTIGSTSSRIPVWLWDYLVRRRIRRSS